MIQPQVPLRLPCYDFTLLKKPRFEYNKTLHPHPSPFWVVWRAVCARSRDVFTARLWHAITTHSSFMRTSYSPQSELRPSLEDYLHLSVSEPIVLAIVARVLPRGFGAYGPTVVHSFLLFITGGPLSVPGIQKDPLVTKGVGLARCLT